MKTAIEAFKGDRHWREAEEDEQRMILDEWTTEQRRNAEVGLIVSTGFKGAVLLISECRAGTT